MKQYILRISVITIVAFALLYTALGFFLLRQQQSSLYRELIESRKIGLNHLVNNAVMPLLDDDALSLNSLLKEAKTVEGLVYGMIIDQKGIIRAHTDVSKLGSNLERVDNVKSRRQEDETLYVIHRTSPGPEVLDISKPVLFMKRELGSVHLGFSSDFIKNQLAQNRTKSTKTLLLWGCAMLVVLIGGAILAGTRHPIPESLSVKKRGKGNLWEPPSPGTFLEKAEGGQINGQPHDSEEAQASSQPWEMARNQVTVLFAGIKGFKAYAQSREPVMLMEDLNEYVSIATDCILKHGGYIDKFIGDAVIAVFANSPLEANHAERAISAAVEMQKAFHNATGRDDNQLLSRVGIGISSGIVLSGTIGPDVKKELTFIGESFKVAYSLNVMAGPGEIIVSRDAYQLLEGRISVEPLPPREMMQRTESWENFRFVSKKG